MVLMVLALFMLWWHVKLNLPMFYDPALYARANNYPYGAVQYMKSKDLHGKLYNEYNWGGYLIWQYPQEKVFIDGRMAIWETPEIQIFSEFQTIMGNHRKTVTDLLDKWGIDLALVAPDRQINGILSLETDTWVQVYRDDQCVLWERRAKNLAESN
jgi:hypothetical protein